DGLNACQIEDQCQRMNGLLGQILQYRPVTSTATIDVTNGDPPLADSMGVDDEQMTGDGNVTDVALSQAPATEVQSAICQSGGVLVEPEVSTGSSSAMGSTTSPQANLQFMPAHMSARELATALDQPLSRVESFLRRHRQRYPYCCEDIRENIEVSG